MGGHLLHVRFLILYRPGQNGIVHVPKLWHPPPFGTEEQFLGLGGTVDDVLGQAQELGDQFPFRQQQGLDHMGGQEAVLGHHPGRQGQFGDPVSQDVEVCHLLDILGEKLEEAGVVDGVVVVVPGVDAEAGLGHGAAAYVEHVGQALAHRGIERLVHIGDPLSRTEVGCPEARHGKPRGHCRRGVLPLGLNKDQGPVPHVEMPLGSVGLEVFSHLGGRGDGKSARRVGGLPFAHDRRRIAIHSARDAGILELSLRHLASPLVGGSSPRAGGFSG